MAPFHELGLKESCSMEELVRAWRQKSLRLHPDKNPGDPKATAKFQVLNNAWQECQAYLKLRRPQPAKKPETSSTPSSSRESPSDTFNSTSQPGTRPTGPTPSAGTGPRPSSSSFYSGFSNGQSEFRARDHYFQSTPSGAFTIHPRSKFGRAGFSPRDVTVKEVGFYSMYGDLDEHERLEPREVRTQMRSLVLDGCRPDASVTVDFDLNEGYCKEALDGTMFKQQLPVLMKWASQHGDDPKLDAIRDKIDIVSTCGLLADLMQGLYSSNNESWIFGAANVNGKVLIGNITRAGIQGIIQDSASTWNGSSHADRSKYWGRRFECYMTEEKGSGDDAHSLNVAAPRFRTVLHTQLRDLHLLLASGVDAENPFVEEEFPRKYVDFVTCSAPSFARGKERALYGRHMLRWWSNNILNGTGNLHVGMHNEGHVTQVKTFRVEDIPNLVKEKERQIRKEFWSPNVCLAYLHDLLQFVKQQVTKPHNKYVYEFSCSNEEGRFTAREIPAKLSEGHDYLLGEVDGFLA